MIDHEMRRAVSERARMLPLSMLVIPFACLPLGACSDQTILGYIHDDLARPARGDIALFPEDPDLAVHPPDLGEELVEAPDLAQSPGPRALKTLSFGEAVPIPAGSNPTLLVAADFDGNGRLDIAALTGVSSSVNLLMGNGNGTFQVPRSFPTPGPGQSMAVGDLNRDNRPDLVVSVFDNGAVAVLLGRGDGALGTPRAYSAGPLTSSLAIADLDADARLDVVAAEAGGPINLLFGDGDGAFEAAVTLPGASTSSVVFVAAGDLDGNGLPDLVTPNPESNDVSVVMATERRKYAVPARYSCGRGAQHLTIADVNRDGRRDLITADKLSRGPSTVTVMLNTGDGRFLDARTFPTGAAPTEIAAADLDLDGRVDLVTANALSKDLSVLRGKGDGTFFAPMNLPAGDTPGTVLIADFNRDGKPDLATADYFAMRVLVMLNTSH